MESRTSEGDATLDRVLSDLQKGKPSPCYLLYGDEEYLRAGALEKILDGLLPSSSRDVQLFVMDGEDEDVDRICETLLMSPLFPGRKVLLVRDTRLFLPSEGGSLPAQSVRGPGSDERLVSLLLEGLPEQNHLVLSAASVDRRKKLFKTMAGCGSVLHFPRDRKEVVRKGQLREEARKLLHDAGKRLSPPAWESLGRKTGFDLRVSITAIRQLIAYVGDRPVIEPADVEALVGKTKEESVFDLTDAMSERDAARCVALLGDLLQQGVHHLMILTMMTREIRHLFHARILLDEGGFSRNFDPGMEYGSFVRKAYPVLRERFSSAGGKKSGSLADSHPFVVFQALKRCRSFPPDRLAEFLQELLRLDVSFKSLAVDPQLSLERFLLRVCE